MIPNEEINRSLRRAAAEVWDADPDEITTRTVADGGSSRTYMRLTHSPTGRTLIGVAGSVRAENEAFCHIADRLRSAGCAVPTVISRSPDGMTYLTSDNGSRSLLDCLRADRSVALPLCDAALRALADMQAAGARVIDFDRCYPVSEMDRRAVMWDLNYFKYCFLKPMLDDIDEPALQDDFDRMADALTDPGLLTGFQMRDCQSRNVMVDDDGRVTLIDFQGGRRGMLLYDAASFIGQTRAGFDADERRHLADTYYKALRLHFPGLGRDDFDRQMRLASAFRRLQTLGAYGFRGLTQRKPQFESMIRPALVTAPDMPDFPAVSAALRACLTKLPRLTVTVTSFAYKHGYPADASGNGGGYVFDCRAMHNPGRYPEYATLTGLDAPVRSFLEERGECARLVEEALRITAPSVERYVSRGFTSLCVAFGCTGGQHRSVYCADRYAAELRRRYPAIRVEVTHREQEDRS